MLIRWHSDKLVVIENDSDSNPADLSRFVGQQCCRITKAKQVEWLNFEHRCSFMSYRVLLYRSEEFVLQKSESFSSPCDVTLCPLNICLVRQAIAASLVSNGVLLEKNLIKYILKTCIQIYSKEKIVIARISFHVFCLNLQMTLCFSLFFSINNCLVENFSK